MTHILLHTQGNIGLLVLIDNIEQVNEVTSKEGGCFIHFGNNKFTPPTWVSESIDVIADRLSAV